jgi:hypothetical protein
MKKYELTDETKPFFGRTLHRIVALRDFCDVKKATKVDGLKKNKTYHKRVVAGSMAMRK